jgi:hypothetical protein
MRVDITRKPDAINLDTKAVSMTGQKQKSSG